MTTSTPPAPASSSAPTPSPATQYGATRGPELTTLSQPSPYSRRGRTRGNVELWSWAFMRGSGVLLLFLVFGHLVVNMVLGKGIKAVDFAFVGQKWSNPFWQVWDLLMLWLAELHGLNGVRTVINDYAEKDSTRLVLKTLLFASAALTISLGTLVIFTFDPCPTGAAANLLPSFCSAK